MKRKHTNNKHCQYTVISFMTTVARTKFRSSSLTFYAYKTLRIANTQAMGPILTKTFGTRQLVCFQESWQEKLARQMIGHK